MAQKYGTYTQNDQKRLIWGGGGIFNKAPHNAPQMPYTGQAWWAEISALKREKPLSGARHISGHLLYLKWYRSTVIR